MLRSQRCPPRLAAVLGPPAAPHGPACRDLHPDKVRDTPEGVGPRPATPQAARNRATDYSGLQGKFLRIFRCHLILTLLCLRMLGVRSPGPIPREDVQCELANTAGPQSPPAENGPSPSPGPPSPQAHDALAAQATLFPRNQPSWLTLLTGQPSVGLPAPKWRASLRSCISVSTQKPARNLQKPGDAAKRG